MADDVTGAVRCTPRPTPRGDDHQTPETAAPAAPGATNPGSPVSPDAENVSGQLSPEAAELLGEQLRPAFEALAELGGHIHDTSNDMQAFLELPDCEACEGSGKDDHATVFEAPLAVHFAGPPVEIAGRRRQLCMWCGHVLSDVPLKDADPAWPAGEMIRVEDGLSTVVPYLPCDTLPPGCCALPDDDGVDPVDGYAADLCGKHTGTCSNRCLLPAHHTGECDDDPEPSQAQETRAAADWPPEPVDQHWDEREPVDVDPGDAIDGGETDEDGDDGA